MPRGHPLTNDQKASILTLANEGLGGQQIAAETGIPRSTVYRLLNRHGESRYFASLIKLIADPSGLFTPHRARFSMLDIALGVRDYVWAEGTAFEIDGQIATVSNGQLICGEKYLEVGWNGRHKWLEFPSPCGD